MDVLGRESWICMLDDDIIFPSIKIENGFVPGNLYCPRRRMLESWRHGQTLPLQKLWGRLPLHNEAWRIPNHCSGYCQIFHADDEVLKLRPWHDFNKWRGVIGADTEFQNRWPEKRRIRPPWEVLHLGKAGTV